MQGFTLNQSHVVHLNTLTKKTEETNRNNIFGHVANATENLLKVRILYFSSRWDFMMFYFLINCKEQRIWTLRGHLQDPCGGNRRRTQVLLFMGAFSVSAYMCVRLCDLRSRACPGLLVDPGQKSQGMYVTQSGYVFLIHWKVAST